MKMPMPKLLLGLMVCGTLMPLIYFILLSYPNSTPTITETVVQSLLQKNNSRRAEAPLPLSPDIQNQIRMDPVFTWEKEYTNFMKDQEHRKKALRNACRTLGLIAHKNKIKKEDLYSVIVNDQYGFMYCQIPKVACTNWRRVLLVLTGFYNTTEASELKAKHVHDSYDRDLTYLSELSSGGISYRVKKYKKFLFVREPFERLLSAFRNKIQNHQNEYFFEKFSRKILKKYRDRNMTSETMRQSNVTFIEFVRYLLDPSTRKRGLNDHWEHFNTLCHPCLLKYDFIGKYETLDRDAYFILRNLTPNHWVRFPSREETYKHPTTTNLVAKYYGSISPRFVQKLWKMYEKDYMLFDYQYPSWLPPLNLNSSSFSLQSQPQPSDEPKQSVSVIK